ncbi:MAG: HDOD domain-containing protein [Candidatus Binatia bacterium]|nr:HDOD domain-containing protein [Candidatus Binatia bacterium]
MRRILVIDAGPKLADGIRHELANLQREGRVRVASDRDGALQELEAGRYDAVVCAIYPTGLDGGKILSHIHGSSPTTVRIAVAEKVEATMPSVSTAHRFIPRHTSPAEMLEVVDRCCNLQGLLVSPSVARLVSSVGTLPPIPHLYAQLIQMLSDPEVGLRDLAQVVERDTAIADRILHVANSAFFGLPRQVKTIEQALNYTGVNTVKSLVLSAEVFRSFSDDSGASRLPLDERQDHALLTANIARRLPADRDTAEEAFTAALLHDVGKLVLASRLPEEFIENVAAVIEQQRPVESIEQDRYGVSHAEVGAYLLALWGLPETIVEAVAHHHSPMRVAHESFELLDAVHLANHLALEQSGESSADAKADARLDPQYVDALQLEERIPEWRAMAAEQAGTDQAG